MLFAYYFYGKGSFYRLFCYTCRWALTDMADASLPWPSKDIVDLSFIKTLVL